jgi:hypothetical protein
MTVYGAEIDRPARPAARTQNVEPWRPGDQRGPDRWRPQHVAADGQAPVPAVDDELSLETRRPKLDRAELGVGWMGA